MVDKKVIIIHNIINPTRTQLFNSFYKFFKSKGAEFKMFFNTATEGNREWDYLSETKKFLFDYEVLDSQSINNVSKKDQYYFHINRGLSKKLDKENPDIIIHAGRASLSAWQASLWAKKNKKQFVLWNESTKYETSWRRSLTKPLVKWLVKNSQGYLAFGQRSWEYLETLGAKKEKIQMLYNTIDVDFFLDEGKRLKSQKETLKQKYGIKTKKVLLYIGQFIPRKGIFELLEGFAEFQKKHPDFSLLMVGNGPEKEKMLEMIQEKNIKNVIFPGFIQKDQISELYAVADIFTLPSYEEVWGLVINEAMCFGLPILTAYRVGASPDLVIEGKNGYVMKENKPKELLSGLEFILEKDLIINNNSLEEIKNFKIDDLVKSLNF